MSNGGKVTGIDHLKNIQEGMDIGMILHSYGITPIIPHLSSMWHDHMIDRGMDIDPDDYLLLDLSIISFCDIIIRLPGDSRGADVEVMYAVLQEIPVATSVDEVIALDRSKRTKEDRVRERSSLRYLLSRTGHTPNNSGGDKESPPKWRTPRL